MLPDVIRTARLTLRPYRASDLSDVLEYATNPRWAKYLPVPQPYEEQHAVEFLALQSATDRATRPSWAVEYQGKVVGGVNILFYIEMDRGELGYSICPEYWGQGLCTEAAQNVVNLSFASIPTLNRISATADARNKASIRVMEKLGMKFEGTLRHNRKVHSQHVDEAWCGILRGEWSGRARSV